MRFRSLLVLIAMLCALGVGASGQTQFMVGGHMGLSVGSAAGQSEAGFQLGPMFEVIFQKNLAIGTELNINTQEGTPVEWADYFKYYFSIPGSAVKPYVDGGFSLWFVTGGPYFGLRFGGGANIPVAKNLYVAPDMQLGPVFTTGSTTFYFTIRGGLRYQF
jgi:hypothetical protein